MQKGRGQAKRSLAWVWERQKLS